MIQVKKIGAQNPSTKADGYVFRQVNTNTETVKTLAKNFIKGSTYNVGEVSGVFMDFGQAIAQALASNSKAQIEGIGLFSLSVAGAGWKENKEDLKKSDIKLSVNFIPSDDFMELIDAAEIKVVTTETTESTDDSDSDDDTSSDSDNSGSTTLPDLETE